MVIVSTGAISLNDLRTEFKGGTGSISLGDLYYNNANNYTKGVDGIPNTGTAIGLNIFYSKAKVQNYTSLVLLLDAKNTLSYSGSGTSWVDLSTKANNVTLYNCTYVNLSGTIGGTISFNGSSSYAYRSPFSSFNSSNWTCIC